MTEYRHTLHLAIICLCLKIGFCEETYLTDVAQILFDLIDVDLPSIGNPFPKIVGPGLSDHICIVGAGPAGIHMATELKNMDYNDITIFEKTGRVGGKCYDTTVDGYARALGASFLVNDYFDNLVELMTRYNISGLHPLESPGVGSAIFVAGIIILSIIKEILRDSQNASITFATFKVWFENDGFEFENKLTYSEYLLKSLIQMTNSTSIYYNLEVFIGSIIKYANIHHSLFGRYDGELMMRPNESTLSLLNVTLKSFLEREGLTTLIPVFNRIHVGAGYGYLDEVGALYGLIWVTPNFLISIGLRALGIHQDPHRSYVIRDGWENIFNTNRK